MYNIKLKYIRPNGIYPVTMDYIVNANSYEEAISIVMNIVNDRIDKTGGSVFSVE